MRLDYQNLAPEATKALFAVGAAVTRSGLDAGIRELVSVRVSQINGCAHCVDIHWRKALDAGVSDSKLRLASVHEECDCFSAAERAALRLAEAMTRLEAARANTVATRAAGMDAAGVHGVVDARLWDELGAHFDPETLTHLVYQICVINAWNRLSRTLQLRPPCE